MEARLDFLSVEVELAKIYNRIEIVYASPSKGDSTFRLDWSGEKFGFEPVPPDVLLPGLTFPRVPGHEVVGKIDALGEGVSGWTIGQRVGVGFLGGHCGVCNLCRNGRPGSRRRHA